jgi:hypothetical protein
MDIKKNIRSAAQIGYCLGTEGDVGNKVSVHHVQMDPAAAVTFDFGKRAS